MTEISTIVFGLLIGYWLVSSLTSEKKEIQKPETKERETSGSENTTLHSDWSTVLNVSPSASKDEIHRAYRAQITQYHPDRVANLGPELQELAEKKSKEINAAYQEAMADKSQ
jgi:DnaJ like chaperone protein